MREALSSAVSEVRGTFEHGADFGIFGRGADAPEAFCRAAEAMFGLMTELPRVEPREAVAIEFDEADVELAFVRWLNLLLAHAADRRLAFARFSLARTGDHWTGTAWGEPWREGLERGADVKGATLTMLSVKHENGAWEVRCVVDV
jgi:SHS2 domain-containing protein